MTTADPDVVGREDELKAITGFLDGVTDRPAALLLQGEAGIGKTTLWRYGIREAETRGQRVFATTAGSSEAQLTFAALGDLLSGALDLRAVLPDPQRRALDVALLLADPGPTPFDPRAIALAATALLRHAAVDHPVLLAIDDVQWLDPASAGVLEFAVRRLSGEPIRLLVAQRVGPREATPPLGLDRALGEALQRLRIEPLSVSALNRILRSRLDLALTRPIVRRVRHACDGNPFFALEIGAVLKARGKPLDPSAPLPIPDDVHELLSRRLTVVSPGARKALLMAAATSEPQASLVELVTSSAAVEEAIAAGVIFLEGTRLRFTHPLLSDAVYAHATPGRRSEIHRRLADVLVDPQERALHLALATEGSDAAVAAELDRAAAPARARGALAVAARLHQEAARVTPPDDTDAAARRTLAAARLWVDAGDHRRAAALVEPLIERLPAGGLHADALIELARTVADRATVTVLQQRALAEVGDDATRKVRILFGLCSARLHAFDVPGAREIANEARGAGEQARDAEWLVLALSMVGRIDTWMAGRGQGADVLRRALELEADSSRVDAYDAPGTWLGWWHLAGDELAPARALLEEQYRRASEAGDDYSRLWLCYPLTELECRAGDYDAAARYAELGYELAEEMENPYVLSALHYALALVAVHTGDVEGARAHADASRRAADEINSRLFAMRHSVVLGVLALALGAYEESRIQLGPLYALCEEAGVDPEHFYSFWPDLVEALLALGQLQRARHIVAEREQHSLALDRVGKRALAARCRGLIAAASGSFENAADLLIEALRLHERQLVPLERARTLLALGQVYRRAKQKRSARKALDEALEVFQRLGAPLWALRARSELERIGGRTASPDDLTASEQRIATLVADGKTNKEVAAELFVTVHTVEAALTRIYSKLGIRSRTELARGPANTPGKV